MGRYFKITTIIMRAVKKSDQIIEAEENFDCEDASGRSEQGKLGVGIPQSLSENPGNVTQNCDVSLRFALKEMLQVGQPNRQQYRFGLRGYGGRPGTRIDDGDLAEKRALVAQGGQVDSAFVAFHGNGNLTAVKEEDGVALRAFLDDRGPGSMLANLGDVDQLIDGFSRQPAKQWGLSKKLEVGLRLTCHRSLVARELDDAVAGRPQSQ